VARGILGVVAGTIAGGIVVALIELAGHAAFPMRSGADIHNLQPGDISTPGFLAVLAAWALGSLIAGWVAAALGGRPAALIVGLILLAGGLANLISIPSPLWFWIAGLLVFIPFALLGARLAPQRALSRAAA
jgi:MFS-type transporter involved in bile tolerance (Atg22 family)